MIKFQNEIKITELPDGGCIVDMDDETVHYTKEEFEEIENEINEIVYSKYIQ